MENQKEIYKRHLGDFGSYLKGYSLSAFEVVTSRNGIADEYNRADIYLKDRKYKKMLEDRENWELNEKLLQKYEIPMKDALKDTRVASRFVFTEVV